MLSRDRRASPGAGASRLCPPQPRSSFSSCSLHRMWPHAWLVPALMREPGAWCSRTETSEGRRRDTRHPLSPKAELTLGFPTSKPALLSWHSPQAPGKPRPLPSLAHSHPKHRGAGKHDACRKELGVTQPCRDVPAASPWRGELRRAPPAAMGLAKENSTSTNPARAHQRDEALSRGGGREAAVPSAPIHCSPRATLGTALPSPRAFPGSRWWAWSCCPCSKPCAPSAGAGGRQKSGAEQPRR